MKAILFSGALLCFCAGHAFALIGAAATGAADYVARAGVAMPKHAPGAPPFSPPASPDGRLRLICTDGAPPVKRPCEFPTQKGNAPQ